MSTARTDERVLQAIMGLHPKAYGNSIQRYLFDNMGKEMSLGEIYAALDRLETSGRVQSRSEPGNSDRNDHPYLYFTATVLPT